MVCLGRSRSRCCGPERQSQLQPQLGRTQSRPPGQRCVQQSLGGCRHVAAWRAILAISDIAGNIVRRLCQHLAAKLGGGPGRLAGANCGRRQIVVGIVRHAAEEPLSQAIAIDWLAAQGPPSSLFGWRRKLDYGKNRHRPIPAQAEWLSATAGSKSPEAGQQKNRQPCPEGGAGGWIR